ncbi:MAG: pteridine reductase [Gammaproteobacteria bacterium RBG_16_51_14]|nr:MAG: pteridine reductase [Gammaproteobacteria bacterium RBG_16_51_14]
MSNKTVLITGAARRIGACIARYLHAAGMDTVIHYNTSANDALSLTSELNRIRPGSATSIQADLLDEGSYRTVIMAAAGFKGHLDVLINNASCFYPSALHEITGGAWEKMISLNLKAPLFLSQAAAGYLHDVSGCIINITDIHAERPLKKHLIYSISKAGLLMLTKSMAREMGPGIRVNAISPGAILWPESMQEETKKMILARTSLQKYGTPEDIAKAVNFLIQDAGYMTGQVLTIDGGRTLFN